MAGTGERYFVRRKTGEPVGPFSQLVITTMLTRGELDGSEMISRDRATWVPVRSLLAPPPEPAPPPDEAAGSWGERDLGELGELALGTLDDHGAHPAAAPSAGMAPPDRASSMDILSLDGLELQSLDLDHSGFKSPDSAADKSTDTSEAQAPTAEAPIRLASLEPQAAQPSAPRRLSMEPEGPLDSPDRPLRSLDPDEPLSFSGGVPADLGDDNLGSKPLTDLGMLPRSAGWGGQPAEAPDAGAEKPGGPVAAARGGRTMSAAKPRPPSAPPVSRKKLMIGAGAVLLLGLGTASFFLFELGDLLVREPTAASVIGDDAADLARDRYPAYERAAKRLLEAAETRPKSVRLRAAAAELLASSVLVRRGDRTRVGKAESTLNETTPHLKKGAPTPPELARARAWVALGRGKAREAAKQLDEGGSAARAGAPGLLLAGWIELVAGKPAAAEALFAQGKRDHADQAAFLFGLGRAQEEANKPEAAVTFAQLAKQQPAHFGAALGLTRVGDFPAAGRVELVRKAISELAKDASRAELADAHAVASRTLRLTGKAAEAAASIEAALVKEPASPTALVAAGELAMDDGRLRDAVARFKQAVPNAPVLPVAAPARDLRFAAAAVLIEEGRAEAGVALLTAPAPAGGKPETDPRGPFWRGRAAELAAPADVNGAVRAYEEALKLDPRYVPATLQLAALLMQSKRPAEALGVLRRAEGAGSPAAALQVALGQALLTSGDLERAKKTFRDVLVKAPRNSQARIGLAAVLEAAGNTAAARGELEALFAQSPDTPGVRPRLAEVLVKLGDRDKAMALYQAEVAAGQASYVTRLAAGKLALDLGRTTVALDLTDKLVADAPQTPGALLLLGKIRRAGGDIAGALAELRRALSFESTPELHYEYARTLAIGGKQEQALVEYEMASTLPAANIERARILAERSDLERAVPLLESALKQVPGNGEAWLLLGNAYDRLGAQPKAVAAWRAAVKASADNAEVNYRLGRWEMDQGQPGPALQHLRAAAAKIGAGGAAGALGLGKPAPWIADCFFQLGFAEKAKGNRAGAITALKKYLAVAAADAPSRPEVEQELGRLGSTP